MRTKAERVAHIRRVREEAADRALQDRAHRSSLQDQLNQELQEYNRRCIYFQDAVTEADWEEADISRHAGEDQGRTCPVAQCVMRNGFTDVRTSLDVVHATKHGMKWEAWHSNVSHHIMCHFASGSPYKVLREVELRFTPQKVIDPDAYQSYLDSMNPAAD